MVYLGSKRYGGRRVGQVANANGNGIPNAFNANGGTVPLNVPNLSAAAMEAIDQMGQPEADFTAQGLSYQAHPESTSLEAMQAHTGADFDYGTAVNADGSPVGVLTVTTPEGAQTTATIPIQAAPAQEEVCEFPAQAVQLQRDVIITNTPPQIVDVETDVCGNVIRYREQITRNMQATQWNAVSGLDAGINGVMDFQVNGQGRIASVTNPNLFLANSLSVPERVNGAVPTVNTAAGRVGRGRKPNYVAGNAAYGVGAMRKFRMG